MIQTILFSAILAMAPVQPPQLKEDNISEVVAAMTDEEKVLLLVGGRARSFNGIGNSAVGVPGAAGTVNGKVRLVNAAGAVPGAAVRVASGASTALGAVTGAVAASATAVPAAAEAKKPVITGIRVDGANVYVTVKGTVPYLQYGLSSGATPDAVAEGVGSPRTGAVADDEEIVLVAPAKKGSAFFKVGRK